MILHYDPKPPLFASVSVAILLAWALSGLAQGAEDATMAALERVPVHTSDRDEEQDGRRKRLREIAVSIDLATDSLDERAWLIMTAARESGLAQYVTEDHDRCRLGTDGHCDSGRAFGTWQVHGTQRTLTKPEQAAFALKRFRQSARFCKARGVEYWLGGISAYATGYRCDWAEAKERLDSMRVIRGRL